MKTNSWKSPTYGMEESSSVKDLTADGFIHVNGSPSPVRGVLINLIFIAIEFVILKGVPCLVTDLDGNEVLDFSIKKGEIQEPTGDPYVIKIALFYNAAYSSNLERISKEVSDQVNARIASNFKELEDEIDRLKNELKNFKDLSKGNHHPQNGAKNKAPHTKKV